LQVLAELLEHLPGLLQLALSALNAVLLKMPATDIAICSRQNDSAWNLIGCSGLRLPVSQVLNGMKQDVGQTQSDSRAAKSTQDP